MKYTFLFLSLLLCWVSCKEQPPIRNKQQNQEDIIDSIDKSILPHYYSIYTKGDSLDVSNFYNDTVTVSTLTELKGAIQNNRLIRLTGNEFFSENNLSSEDKIERGSNLSTEPLLIEGLKNLKIVGNGRTMLFVSENSLCDVKIHDAFNIHLDSLILGRKKMPESYSDGVLKIDSAFNIQVTNCRIIGEGAPGLRTKYVNNFSLLDVDFTACSSFIFELVTSTNVLFENCTFFRNELSTSVLGGFAYGSKELLFLNCDFYENAPVHKGNPFFNVREIEELIVFKDCTFKKNKGFKWYGNHLKLINCELDSSDFIGLK